jgi:hypothetical protein
MTHPTNANDPLLFSFMGPGRWSQKALSALMFACITAVYMVFIFTIQMFEGWSYSGVAASFVLLVLVLLVALPICYLSAKLLSPFKKYAFPAGFNYAELRIYGDRVEIRHEMAEGRVETIPLSEIEGICIAAGENAAERFLTGIEPDQQRSLERLRNSASGWVCLKRKGSRDGIFISGWSGKNIISNLHEYIRWHRQGSMGRKIALAQRISSQTGLPIIGLYKAC